MVSSAVALLSTLLIGLLGAWIFVVIKVRREQPRTRPVVRVRHVLGPVFLVAAVVAMGVTPLAALSFDLTYEVSSSSSPDGDAIPVGEPATETIEVPVEPLPGTTYVVRSGGVDVEEWQLDGATMLVTVSIPPAEQPGTYSATLQLTPYPVVLPGDVLEGLHDRSPLAGMLGSAAALVIPPFLLSRLLLDGDRPLFRTRNRWLWRRLGDWP